MFKVHAIGKRPLNQQEQSIMDGYELIRNKKQEEIDLITDGSTSFYMEKKYYKSKNAEYLMGHVVNNGLRFDRSIKQVFDDNIKGVVTLVYKLI